MGSSHASSTRRPLAAGQQQFQQSRVPEGVALARLCGWVAGQVGGGLLGLVPAAQRERANVGDFPLQVKNQPGGVGFAALACLLESDVEQIVTGQRHHSRCVGSE